MTGEPPSLIGAVQPTTTWAFPGVPDKPVGASGAVEVSTGGGGGGGSGADGVTARLGDDAGEVPAVLVAVTVNVYAVPLVNPLTVALVPMFVVAVAPPGDAVTVYPVITEPPLLTGAIQDTTAWALPGVADTPVGASGAVEGETGVTGALADEASDVPAALAAVTANVYAVPFVKPPTVTLVPMIVVALAPPGDAVTVYPVIAEPPLLTGAVQLTTTWALPGVADTPVGAPGTVLGVTGALADEASEVPATLAAVTVNVYAVPFVSPETVAGPAPTTLAVAPPGDAVTVYPVITDPPLLTGAIQDTTAWALPAAAVTPVGAPGAVTDDGVVIEASSRTNEVAAAASS